MFQLCEDAQKNLTQISNYLAKAGLTAFYSLKYKAKAVVRPSAIQYSSNISIYFFTPTESKDFSRRPTTCTAYHSTDRRFTF